MGRITPRPRSSAPSPRPTHRALATLACLLATLTLNARAGTLGHIRQIHTLRCGINQETPEYSRSDDHGPRQAFDTDICRAVAVAILGPDARVTVTNYPDDVAAMAALRAGRVDLLPTLTLDLTHASNPAITFSPSLLYDGVGFLVPTAANLTHATQLSGRKICLLSETQIETATRAWFSQQNLKFVPFPFQEEGEMEAAFVTGNCAALAGDLTRLAGTRAAFGQFADRYTLLPEEIARDPLAAASSSADPAFAAIVRWTIEVLLNAEDSNFTQSAAKEGSTVDPNPTLDILTGRTREVGARLGLTNAWAVHVIAAVGNYAELYDRDLGAQSPLKLPRAFNRLDTDGGLMVPLPLK